MGIPREFLSLHEEVEMSLDRLHVNGQLFIVSISHETFCITDVPTDGAENNTLMKAVDDMFQVYCKCGFQVMKLHCNKK